MILRELLEAIDEGVTWDRESAEGAIETGDVYQGSLFTVTVCFMCEEETWITLPLRSPMLVPYYDAEISISPSSKTDIQVWMYQKDWFPTYKE